MSVELSYEELDEYITTVSTGIKLVRVSAASGGNIDLLFKQPTSEDRMFARFVYKQTYAQAKTEGLKTVSEMEEIMLKRGIISEEYFEEIKSLEKKLEAQRTILAKTYRVKARQERLVGIIQGLEEELRAKKQKRDKLLGITAEAKANEARLFYLCSKCVFKSEKERLWETEKDFNSEKDLTFRMEALSEFADFVAGLPTSLVRYIARSNLWRVRYLTSVKTGADLFGRPISEYTPDMINLLYWSHYYQSIYDMMPDDQPDEEIVDDDSALDAYMDDYYKRIKNERASRRGKSSGKLDAFDKNEVIVTPSHDLHKDFDYDKPREAQRLKDTKMVKAKAKKKKSKRNLER